MTLPGHLQATYYAYLALLTALLASCASRWRTLQSLVYSAVSVRRRRSLLSGAAIVATLLLCAQGFHQRSLYAVLCAALGAASVVAMPAAWRKVAMRCALLLVAAGAFTCLPLQRATSLTLVVMPCFMWAAVIGLGAAATPRSAQSNGKALAVSEHTLAAAFAQARRPLSTQASALVATALCICATQQVPQPSDDPVSSDGHFSWTAWLKACLFASDSMLIILAAPLRGPLATTVGIGPALRGMKLSQLLMWAALCGMPLLALRTPAKLLPRLLATVVGLAAPLAIMSNSWEGLFFAAFGGAVLSYAALAAQIADCGALSRTPSERLAAAAEQAGDGVLAWLAATAQRSLPTVPLQAVQQRSVADKSNGLQHTPEPGKSATAGRSRNMVRRSTQRADVSADHVSVSRSPAPGAAAGKPHSHGTRSQPIHSPMGTPPGTPTTSLSPMPGARQSTTHEGTATVSMRHAWAATVLIVGTNLAFFGTGNMASVATFEPASVLRLMTCAPIACLHSSVLHLHLLILHAILST